MSTPAEAGSTGGFGRVSRPADERARDPAQNLLTDLLERPGGEGLGTLVLIDEVPMYARVKVAADGRACPLHHCIGSPLTGK